MDEYATSSPEDLELQLEGFEGPLELLLDLARRQRVDLAQISILTLVDQYLAAVSGADRIDLARAVDWLVMAAWLTWLKSRLLVPKDLEEAKEAQRAARTLADRLAELERVRSVTAWLESRPQLGRDMFERGRPEPPTGPAITANFLTLFEACLSILQSSGKRPPEFYRPPPRHMLWTPAQATSRMRTMLADLPEGCDLLAFVPKLSVDQPDRTRRVRVAIASTLVASLELARSAEACLQQTEFLAPIVVRPRIDAAVEDNQPAA